MANVWFSVLVLIFANKVFATYCPENNMEILNCDQCMRCGGSWCSQPKNPKEHCSYFVNDDWCKDPEMPTRLESRHRPGQMLEPVEEQKSIVIGIKDRLAFSYSAPSQMQVWTKVESATQDKSYVYVRPDNVTAAKTTCDGSKCKIYIETIVNSGFCSVKNSSEEEFVEVSVKVENTTEQARIKYHVPCACACSKDKELRSPRCSGNGDYQCGICTCHGPWTGDKCEVSNCGDSGRGDVPCVAKNNKVCSGNGHCGVCDTCECYTNMTGWQYLDPASHCSDICMDTSGCEHCLTNGTLGPCSPADLEDCGHELLMLKYNETTAKAKDSLERDVWVKCNMSFKEPDCLVKYMARKTADGVHVMVVESCNDHTGGHLGGVGETKVPIILGILGVVAAVAAVGGVLLWKHLNAAPAMPFASPDYQNIDAEDCVGENPLYKSPTSTFTNPQFGKC